ncbi:TetR/AcrR family transcriptional regulator [Paenibacillus macquariensis]|uniref:Transcriptional regulator, TetR family n=1 Tax=Paenibacillus macquariensis TaxID=948756 RepID=A0ABY1KGB2_9BACL|nr:TetR/AcrR family transcriptional regulator [Paenibacillus macquariensis]OAB33089.1 TetR family transcriptional regulator [Paenibacillus macquariensis subsp. macquariensis]SIR69080.1 transcriptional regulator, TetR family [Paenibacillus macquariensis]
MARTGRPRIFDRDEALLKAMMLFWEQGYEATSLLQLRADMGNISAASFYAAFESKEALFKETVEQYMGTFGRVTESLADLTLTPREAIETTLRRTAKMQTDSDHPNGCLIVLSASTCSSKNNHIREIVAEKRKQIRSHLHDCIQRAIDVGEIPSSIDVSMLTTVFDTFMHGISTQARDGVPFATIDRAITEVMGIWELFKHSA